MLRVMRSFSTSLVLLVAVACASAPKGESADASAARGSLQSPQLIRSGPPPELRIPPQTSVRTVVMDVKVEVMVDTEGNPDMTTFRAIGRGAEVNQDTLRTWIAQQRFRPAERDGQRVPALFKISMQARRR